MKKRKVKNTQGLQITIVLFVIISVLFSALVIILAVGMIPTFVSFLADKSKEKVRTMTVGLINMAGCVPFMMEVFKKGNTIDVAISYILEPRTIVVIYLAAGIGYMIDWAVTGVVSSVSVQKAKKRLIDIEKQKKELIERWGIEVTGKIPIDEYGFPMIENKSKEETDSSS